MPNITRYAVLWILIVTSCSNHSIDVKQTPSCVHEMVYANTGGIYEYIKELFTENQEECLNILEVAKIDCGSEDNIFAIKKSKRRENVHNKKRTIQNTTDIHILTVQVWCRSNNNIVCHVA